MYKEIIVDIETLDTEPSAVVLSIGAVKFNLNEEDNYDTLDDPARCFYSIIDVTAQIRDLRRTVSFDTTAWWIKQNKDAQGVFLGERPDIETTLHSFTRFCGRIKNLWGNGSNFDNTILRSLYSDMGMIFPFAYWDDRDIRTLKYLAGDKKPNIARGTEHHALEDAKYEALCCQEYFRSLNR